MSVTNHGKLSHVTDQASAWAGGESSPSPEEEGESLAERWASPLAVDSVEKTSFSSTVTRTPLSPSEPVRGFRTPRSLSEIISLRRVQSSWSFYRGTEGGGDNNHGDIECEKRRIFQSCTLGLPY